MVKWWEWKLNPEEAIMQGLNPAIQLPQVSMPIQIRDGRTELNVSRQNIPDGKILLEHYRVEIDATNVLSGTQKGYGFVDEDGRIWTS